MGSNGAAPRPGPRKRSAGTIVARREKGQWQVLLLRCYAYWDFPKGELDGSEDPLLAALRETTEETGLLDLEFPWGRQFYDTPTYSRGKVARYYLATTETSTVVLGVNPHLGHPEHHEYRWTTFAEAERLLNERLRTALRWAADVIARHSTQEEPPCPTNSNH